MSGFAISGITRTCWGEWIMTPQIDGNPAEDEEIDADAERRAEWASPAARGSVPVHADPDA